MGGIGKKVLSMMIVFSIIFGCVHNNVYASDFIVEENSSVTQEEFEGETQEIIDELPPKASEVPEDENNDDNDDNASPDEEKTIDSENEEVPANEELPAHEEVPADEELPVNEDPSIIGSESGSGENGKEPADDVISDNPEQESGLRIVNQSEDVTALIGDTINFFVETDREDSKYEWLFSKDEGVTWQKCGYNGYKTGRISFELQSYHYGYKFKCIVRDGNGSEVSSNVFSVYEKATSITEQPVSVDATIGNVATFAVNAEGNKLSYRWYYSQDNGNTWRKVINYTIVDEQGNKSIVPYDGYADKALSFTVTNVHYGYQFKCVITDRLKNTLESDKVYLLTKTANLDEQPKDEYRLIGEKATFHVASSNPAVTYQWYVSKDQGVSWVKCGYNGNKTNTLSFDVQAYQYGYRFRCVVSASSENQIISDECSLLEKETTLSIVNTEIETEIGKTTELEVSAVGNKLSYRWYYSTDAGKNWNKCTNYYAVEDGIRTLKTYGGYTGNVLSFVAQEEHGNMLFKCVVTDRAGNKLDSDAVTIKFKPAELVISEQPTDVYGLINDEAVISVKAEGTSLKYVWYFSKNKGTTWAKCGLNGYRTDTLKFPIQKYQYGYMFYCVIEDMQGRQAVSDKVTLYEKQTQIVSEPEDVLCELGDEVELLVEAEGNQLSYIWLRSPDNGENWETCLQDTYKGTNTNKLSFVASAETAKYVYRCEVTDRLRVKTLSRTIKIDIKEEEGFISLGEVSLEPNATINGLKSILSMDYIRENAVISENGSKTSLILTPQNALSDYNVFLLHFYAISSVKNSDITIKINNNRYTGNYSVPTYITEFILPVKGISKLEKLTIDAIDNGQKIKICNFEVLSTDGKDISEFKLGVFDRDEAYREVLVDEKTAIGYQAVDLLSDGTYLYSLGKGELVIYDLSAGSPKVLGAVYGLGNAREMVFCNGGNALVVSSRENGIFTIDISDKTNPIIASEMPSQGLSTGLCVQDSYCFVASRRFGVEIYDISDIYDPKFVTLISGYNEEYYDCSVWGQYLYVSSWAEAKISVFDIACISSPSKVTEFYAGGNAAGTVIRDDLLYIATGYHSKDSSSNVAAPGYGMGNGLDIFDISNPKSPKKVSSTKINGRYFYSGFDHWNVDVSGNYAFLSNAYTGVHVINIADPYAPKKLSNIGVDIPYGSNNYKTIVSDTYLLPYDSSQYSRAIITGLAITNGGIYYSTSTGNSYYGGTDISKALGLYYFPVEDLVLERGNDGTYDYDIDDMAKEDIEYVSGNYRIKETCKNEDIWSICSYDNKYYCATGKREIVVLNQNYEVIERHSTSGITKDAVEVNGVLYVAESNAGLFAYSIKNGSFDRIGSIGYNSYATVFTTVNVFDDNYLLAQVSWTRYALICITDPTNPYIVESINAGSMYDRSLIGQTGRSNLQSVFGRTYLYWYEASATGRPKIIKKFTSPKYAEQNGIAYGNGYAVTIYNNGYVYYDPRTITQGEYNDLPVVKVSGAKLRGMPNIRDNIMVVSNCFGRNITIVDISDIDNPVLITEFSVDGNPDEVYSDVEGKYIIPLRHGGLVEIVAG